MRSWFAATLAAFFAVVALPARAADPDALWNVVSGQCVPNQQARQDPGPCVSVDLAGGYAVLKDQSGATQVLVIATTRITGIESPALLDPAAPNYWADAWAARHDVEQFAHREIPREDVALAVNSIYGRSQDQLHIHVDCIRPDVRDALNTAIDRIGPKWAPLDVSLAGHRYKAMRIAGEDLATPTRSSCWPTAIRPRAPRWGWRPWCWPAPSSATARPASSCSATASNLRCTTRPRAKA
ncbi:MAG: CDP-diacylglycerol diphosphatase [Caulobacteraceae bacterium]